MAIAVGLSENHVGYSGLDLIHCPRNALEPNQFQLARPIAEMPYQSFLKPSPDQFHFFDRSFDLYKRHEFVHFPNGIKPGAVFVAQGLMLEEFAEGKWW